MHDNRVLPKDSRAGSSTGETTSWCCSCFTSISITRCACSSFLILKLNFSTFRCLNEWQLNLSSYILSFSLSGWSCCVCVMVSSTLILENIVIKLVKRIFIKSLPSITIPWVFIVILTSFILISQCFISTSINDCLLFRLNKKLFCFWIRVLIRMVFLSYSSKRFFNFIYRSIVFDTKSFCDKPLLLRYGFFFIVEKRKGIDGMLIFSNFL